MPPLGESFKPSTELTQLEEAEHAEIERLRAELSRVMESLVPPLRPGRIFGQKSLKSATAYYPHPGLPEDQRMEAYVERLKPFSDEYLKLDARPVRTKNNKPVTYYHSDTRATASDGMAHIQINGFFSNGNFDSLGHAQKLEAMDQIADTLALIAEANAAQQAEQVG